jgi:two-component system response regulator ChvI
MISVVGRADDDATGLEFANGHDQSTGCVAERRKISVLLVDDDDDFREAASTELECLGFSVAAVADGEAMERFIAEGNRQDAIILDWQLPRRSGLDYLRSLRHCNVMTPVIILTGSADTVRESTALDCGAHDFVDKSRGIDILARRVRRVVAGQATQAVAEMPNPAEIVSGRLLLRTAANRAYWGGVDLNLTVTEFNIVHLMVDQANEHVSYRAIYDRVHHPGFIAGSGEDGFRTNVRSMVKRIRNKFRAVDPEFCQIENFSAFGYRWRTDEADLYRAPAPAAARAASYAAVPIG